MKDLLRNWKSLLFNIAELLLILLSGYLLNLKIEELLTVLFLFCGVRVATRSAKHYKSWKKCLCWSLLLITSLFLLTKISIWIAAIMSIFAAIIISGKGDINDCFMYRNNTSEKKYRELKFYVDTHMDSDELRKFESLIINFNERYSDRFKVNLYEIYKLIFYENKSYEDVKKIMNLRDDNHIIVNALDMVFICFDTYAELENYKKLEEDKGLAKIS